MNLSYQKIEASNKDILIVSFAGQDNGFGGIVRFEFVKFLDKHFPDINRHFYLDKRLNCYHEGIEGISHNIEDTVDYFKKEFAPYKKIIFIGTSGGGYAAILFGSLLKINTVLAFIPQTIRRQTNEHINETFRDLKPHINNVTKYYLYGDPFITNPRACHCIQHCSRIEDKPNVTVIKIRQLDMKILANNGELYKIIHDAIFL